MAPGRRRGAKWGRTKRELSLGDLILAKIKGFPAWPAKIARPEDWKKSPDSKKKFVEFFGTSEIAFVAPADIQEFTHEVKKKLYNRGSKGKNNQKFDLAVKQICEEFDKWVPKNPRTGGEADSSQTCASESDSPDQMVNEAIVATENDGIEMHGPSLRGCSQKKSEVGTDVDDSSSDADDVASPLVKEKKLSRSASAVDKKSLADASAYSDPLRKDEVKEEGGSSDDDLDEFLNSGVSPTAKRMLCRKKGSTIIGKVYRRKGSLGGNLKITSLHSEKSSRDVGIEKTINKLVDRKICRQRADDSQEASLDHTRVITRRSMNAKVPKTVDIKGNACQARTPYSPDKTLAATESKRSESVNQKPVELGKRAHESKDIDGDEHAPAKRRFRAVDITQSSGLNADIKSMKSATLNSDVLLPDKTHSPVVQLPKKRRAVRLCDMEDDECPKTPIHGGLTSKPTPQVSNPKNKSSSYGENFAHTQRVSRNSGMAGFETREHLQSGSVLNQRLSAAAQRSTGKPFKEYPAPVLQSEKRSSLDSKPVISAKGSPESAGVTMQIEDMKFKSSDRVLGNVPLKKMTHERIRAAKDVKTSVAVVSQISDSVMSMKNLIAAAQKRKRQARLQNSFGDPLFFVPDADIPPRSPSPLLPTQAPGFMPRLDIQGSLPTVLDSDAHECASADGNENAEPDENGLNAGNQEIGSSISVDTEAAVARDAFEGMIETLSRTKESIGRATRLAIDCAKFGIANEVMELLVSKLETELSLHRKVDILFLVDSITQCSHSHRGIAGASYIPIVSEVLPRLFGAAAPAGFAAQENRRQCLKVLRLWLERKILPETVICACINDIKLAQDDSPGLLKRRSSRSERAIHDPIREMEGIVVDEYGSNATFHLPGLLSGNILGEEEYEETSTANLGKEIDDTPPSKPSSPTGGGPGGGNHSFTSNDQRHCILEDVDGELEMEDVSGNHIIERLSPPDTSRPFELESTSEGAYGSACSISTDSESSSESPPPLPPGPPPPSPLLPTSPQPTSFFYPTPPQSPPVIQKNSFLYPSSQAPFCPLPSVAAPQPAVVALPPSVNLPSVAPPHQIGGTQMSNAPRPPPNSGPQIMSNAPPPPRNDGPQMMSNALPPPPNGGPRMMSNAPPPPPNGGPQMMPNAPPPRVPLGASSLPPFGPPPFGPVAPPMPAAGPPPVASPMPAAGHPPPPAPPMQVHSQQSFLGHPPMHSRNMPQVPSLMSHAPQLAHQPPMQHEVSIRNGVLSQQSSCRPPPGISSQQRQHFLPGSILSARGHVHPEAPLRAASHFSYPNASQRNQPPPYSSMNFSDGPARYASAEKQWMAANQFNADASQGGWMAGGRPHSGYLGFRPERPHAVALHHPAPNALPSGQVPVCGGTTMPHTAASSSLNWRPS